MSEACELLHERISRLLRFDADFAPGDIPANGVYVMFERGENAHGTDRIVRVGTHTGGRNLQSRLQEHFRKENKDRSIFRKHIGRCLLASRNDNFLKYWDIDLTSRAMRDRHEGVIDGVKKNEVERKVSRYLSNRITFAVLSIVPKPERVAVERRILSTVASCGVCHPGKDWLGRHHRNESIRNVGLWNIQGLNDHAFTAAEVEDLITATAGVWP